MSEYKLGRVPAPEDKRDADYPFRLALAATPSMRTYRYWTSGPVSLDQDGVGACVGFTGANWLQSSPVRTKVINQTGFDLYYACKEIDGYPGEGTWDRVLMQVLQNRGHIKRYLWAQNPNELDQWLLEIGPVLIGIPWLESMFDPDADGYLRVAGTEVGGHEVLIRGINRGAKPFYTITNSWGRNWGDNGHARIARDDLRKLLFDSWGSACTAEESVAVQDR